MILEPLESRSLLSDGGLTFTGSTVLARLPSAVTAGETAHWVASPSIVQRLVGMDRFWADPRFSEIDGSGYTSVILDTGIDKDHPFFGPDANRNRVADRIVYSYDFADKDGDASDVDGHGSNVSSIVGSSDAAYPGMAPGVRLIHLKVFSDHSGLTAFSDVERALQWVVQNVERFNIASVNMSLGDNGFYQTHQSLYGLSDELAALATKRVIVTAAAGNDYAVSSAQGINYPAADPNVLAVGAVYSHKYGSGATARRTGADRLTPFTQRTTSLWQIFAPGAPISGAGPRGGIKTQEGTSQAAPHVAGMAVLMQQLADRVLGRRLSVEEFRSLALRTGKRIIDGDDERDGVRNTGAAFRRIDVFAMARAIWGRAGAEALLRHGSAVVRNEGSAITFGSTPAGTSVVKVLTIENTGARTLVLGGLGARAGFSIASPFGARQLAPGDSTTFAVRLDGSRVGTFKGQLRLTTNDSDERMYVVALSGTVSAVSAVADDGTAAVRLSGGWRLGSGGYAGDHRTAARGDRDAIADWTFSGLLPGRYRISATWIPGEDMAKDATFLFGSESAGDEVSVDQRLAPVGRTIGGVLFTDLAEFDVTGTELIVTLEGSRTGRVMADAVRIERVGTLRGGPALHVTLGTTPIVDGLGTVSFSPTPSGRPTQKILTIRNVGTSVLRLDSIDMPEGFRVVVPPAMRLKPGTSTTMTVQIEAGAPGSFAGSLLLSSNDEDRPDFLINLAGTVTPTVVTIDNGESGFLASGSNWSAGRYGFRNDALLGTAGGGDGSSSARWSFTRLTPGLYRVAAAWPGGLTPSPVLASNAMFAIMAGDELLAMVFADQRVRPEDEVGQGATWRYFGEFRVTGTTLTVVLTDLADGMVIADAVRLERTGN